MVRRGHLVIAPRREEGQGLELGDAAQRVREAAQDLLEVGVGYSLHARQAPVHGEDQRGEGHEGAELVVCAARLAGGHIAAGKAVVVILAAQTLGVLPLDPLRGAVAPLEPVVAGRVDARAHDELAEADVCHLAHEPASIIALVAVVGDAPRRQVEHVVAGREGKAAEPCDHNREHSDRQGRPHEGFAFLVAELEAQFPKRLAAVIVVEVGVLGVKHPAKGPDARHARVVPKGGAAELLVGEAAAIADVALARLVGSDLARAQPVANAIGTLFGLRSCLRSTGPRNRMFHHSFLRYSSFRSAGALNLHITIRHVLRGAPRRVFKAKVGGGALCNLFRCSMDVYTRGK